MSRIALKSYLAVMLVAAAMPLMAAESPGCDPLAFYDSVIPNVVSVQDQRGMDEVGVNQAACQRTEQHFR